MQKTNPSQIIQIPLHEVSPSDSIQQLSEENFRFRQIIDEMANKLATQQELIQQLRDEIAILKGQKPKPKIPPSKLEGPNSRPDWRKRIAPHDHQMKSVLFSAWMTGLTNFHIPSLHHCFSLVIAVPALQHTLEISRLARLIIRGVRRVGKSGQPRGKPRKKKKTVLQNHSSFIEEASELLPAATKVDKQLQVDDTGGRHKGQNQYTTIIGNRWFSVFTTTDSKSRINFLRLLQGGKEECTINEDTLEYLSQVNSPSYLPGYMALSSGNRFVTSAEWEQFLQERNITRDIEKRFLTEAALYASVIRAGIPRDLGVHSDDAGQFDIFCHSLCWIHEERHYRKLIMMTDESRLELDHIEEQIWTIYQALKAYKKYPSKAGAGDIEKQFDQIFQQKTSSPTLNRQLEKTYEKKQELLIVLQRPETPLHNNSSETCARAAKIKLKISGGTRSELGQKVRDIFLSLKQTCRKLEINFMSFLQDRVRGEYKIPRLATIICERALAAAKDPPNLSSLPVYPLNSRQLVG